MKQAITAQNLSFRYGKKQILDKITFEIAAGEIFGLLGPSGAGKTTLIKLLTGQLVQETGSAKLLSKDTRKLSSVEHRQIGIMMDDLGLYERLSAYDNLSFYADIYRVSHQKITDVLESIGLYEARNTAVSKLSKGMKNRLSLARALMNDAKILFLDEPTSGLDPVTAKEIHDILTRQKKKGMAIFLTTHNMSEAESLCDHVALLNEGHIIEYGKPAEVCRKYNHLNQLQVTLKGGELISLKNSSGSAIAIKEYLEKEQIESIHSTEPTLETVFIELTGRGLD